METGPLRIVVIESHPLMREALCDFIASEPDLKLLAGVPNGTKALKRVVALNPDVILFALGNPGLGDLDTLVALRRALPGTFLLALVTDEAPGQEQVALQAGADAVLKKTVQRAALLRGMREKWGLHTQTVKTNNPEMNPWM